MELKRGGYLKAIFTDRSYSDFVEDFICADNPVGGACPGPGDTGTTNVVVEGIPVGEFNNIFIANSNVPQREYQSFQVIGRYRLTDNWTVDGHWTHQLKNEGNFEGEGTNTPGISSTFGDYPGYFVPSRHFPVGKFNDYQADKIRAWTNYNMDLGRAGNLNFGFLGNYDSGRAYSLTDTIPRGFSAQQQAVLAYYLSRPGTTQTIFFGERGSQKWSDSMWFDLSVNYALPIWKDLDVWIKADLVNIFNDDSQIGGNINADDVANGPVDAFGLPTSYTLASNHAIATTNAHFVAPREYQFTVGFRF
jgi:hypothetical protein